jgi:RNA-directed DNA polymerase
MPGRYPINQSPLFRLKSRRKLAKLLGCSVKELELLANKPNYSFFSLERPNKDPRSIQNPSKDLKKAQAKISKLLGRVQAPNFVQSGYKGTSYISNALEHLDTAVPLFKIDIKKFFASSDAKRVETMFLRGFECSPDISALLRKLNTIHGHIPTGGCSSTMMSYWAYADMFLEISVLVSSHGVKMTLCVDDMTCSGTKATRSLRFEVEKIIKKYGLLPHKRHHVLAGNPKIVTGVAVTAQGIRLPNKRRRQLHQAHQEVDAETNVVAKFEKAQILLGRATEASQIEDRFRADVIRASFKLKEATEQALRAGYTIVSGKLKLQH